MKNNIFVDYIYNNYGIKVNDIIETDKSNKIFKIITTEKEFILKKCNIDFNEKVKFLKSQNINNIIYPLLTKDNSYILKFSNDFYFIYSYYEDINEKNEIKAQKLLSELSYLHHNTKFQKTLSPIKSKKKFEEIFNYLQYKSTLLETFVRSIEQGKYDEYSIMILKNYHYILDAFKYMEKINRNIINFVKDKITVDYVFLHGSPKLNHLINNSGHFLISYQDGYFGICSLDIAKYYINIEDLNINHYEIINNYFSDYNNDFYFNYFCFLVFLYFIKSIIVYEKDYISSQSFIYASEAIKNFLERFKDKIDLIK